MIIALRLLSEDASVVKHEVAGKKREAEEAEKENPDPETDVCEPFVFWGDGRSRQEEERETYKTADNEQGQPDRMRHLLRFLGRS
jgi:hypothetical protein